ncbi:MAG: type-4 uracil-DNA glycosylase [Candidatus Syntropharchaeia archaeon]
MEEEISHEMERIRKEVKKCRRCELWKTRKNPVVGEGSLYAGIIFIGEAPGYYEDLKGKPFVGKAGKILDELLQSVGLERRKVYITNVLKCRPPNNRNPTSDEIKACSPFLDRQIEIIQPMILVTLGNFALIHVFDKFGLKREKISRIHGKVFEIETGEGKKKIIPLYHPAVATYNPAMRNVLFEDFDSLKECLDGSSGNAKV